MQRIALNLPDELLARVEAQRHELGQTRTAFIVRALEAAVREQLAPKPTSPEPRQAQPAASPGVDRASAFRRAS